MSLTAVTWLIIEICSKVCRSFHRKHFQAYNLSKGHTAVVSPGGNECILPRVLGRHICQRRQKNMSSVGTCRYFTVGGTRPPQQSKVPLQTRPVESWDPVLFVVHWPQTASRSVQPFLQTVSHLAQHTDRQTTLHTTSVAIGRVYTPCAGIVA